MTTEFWPAEIQDSSGIIPPIAVMKAAAADLAAKTNNVLRGEIETIANPLKGEFEQIFFVVAPALEDYRYELLRVTHAVTLYPAWIGLREHQTDFKGEVRTRLGEQFQDAESLGKGLAAAFAIPRIQNAVKALLAQSRAA
jgi:hypothetical protein